MQTSLEAALLAYRASSDELVRGMVSQYGAALGITAAEASSAAPSAAWGHFAKAAVAAGISETPAQAPPSHRPLWRSSFLTGGGAPFHYRAQGLEMGHHAPSRGKGKPEGACAGVVRPEAGP